MTFRVAVIYYRCLPRQLLCLGHATIRGLRGHAARSWYCEALGVSTWCICSLHGRLVTTANVIAEGARKVDPARGVDAPLPRCRAVQIHS